MEKNLIQSLDKILEISSKVRSKYQDLRKKNVELEVQLSDLKVEADQYKNQINLLQRELENRAKEDKNSMLSITDDVSEDAVQILKQKQNIKNAEIKKQLDMFIDDIDQCIQIVQKKE
ncbi:MAG: hypothetical protein WAT22_02670 [Saprospiraceae bacterium]|nr:hypothetical protein [Saprospiraceae bacterium]MBP6447343.1 hypothetical protein [Saprospiraceae bacterium]